MIPNGTRVLVNGKHDGQTFENEYGTVVQTDIPGWQLVRFDTPRDAFHIGNAGSNHHHWYFPVDSECLKALTAPSTYLNGLDIEFPAQFEPRYEWSEDPIEFKPPFKEGDRVRLIRDNGRLEYGTAGDEGTVLSVQGNSVDVRFDVGRGTHGGNEWLVHQDNLELIPERARPRFMTAWLVNDDRFFVPTGDAFMTKEAADAGALETLKENEVADQIAVLELRTVHMARLTITSEAA